MKTVEIPVAETTEATTEVPVNSEEYRTYWLKQLEAVPDGDPNAMRDFLREHPQPFSDTGTVEVQPTDDTPEGRAAFHADLDAVPDNDPDALRAVIAKHGRLPKNIG